MKKRRKKSFYGMIGFVFGLLVGCIATFFVMHIVNLEKNENPPANEIADNSNTNQTDINSSNEDMIETEEINVNVNETDEEEMTTSDLFKVESLYCDFYYPLKWEEKVLIEEALNVVHFSANLGEGKIIDIFDVVSAEFEEGSEMEVHIIEYELEFDEAWTDEEKQMVREMQEDVSYIVEHLEKEGITVIY